eukprot:Tbor_TRINITY_DN5927_c3_g2::TRINITY_DN5927_c3_g2_i2::g.18272::m.18272
MYNYFKYKDQRTSIEHQQKAMSRKCSLSTATATQSINTRPDLFLHCPRRQLQQPKLTQLSFLVLSVVTIMTIFFDLSSLLPIISVENYNLFHSSFSPSSSIAEIFIGAVAYDTPSSVDRYVDGNTNKEVISPHSLNTLTQEDHAMNYDKGLVNKNNPDTGNNLKLQSFWERTQPHRTHDLIEDKSKVRQQQEDKNRQESFLRQKCVSSGKGTWKAGACTCISGWLTSTRQNSLDKANFTYCGEKVNPLDKPRVPRSPTENMTTSEKVTWFFTTTLPAALTGSKDAWESTAMWMFVAAFVVTVSISVYVVWRIWKSGVCSQAKNTEVDGGDILTNNNIDSNLQSNDGLNFPPFTSKEMDILQVARRGGKYGGTNLEKLYYCPSEEDIQKAIADMRWDIKSERI